MWGAIADIGMGLLGFGGQASTNRANRDMAREQMAFQERMSSTAAQRSVEDYRRAGLNPALAYERTASSPGGASAVINDAVEKGISTAQHSRTVRASLAAMKAQTEHSRASAGAATATANNQLADAALKNQALTFNTETMPYTGRQMAAKALLEEAAVSGASNTAALQKLIAPYIQGAGQISNYLRTNQRRISGAVRRTIDPKTSFEAVRKRLEPKKR